MKIHQIVLMGLLVALLSIPDAFAGRRTNINTLSSSERTAVRTQIMNYLTSEQNTGASNLADRYLIVKEHKDNDAYIHNYNEIFLGWHRRYIEGAEAYVIPRLSSSLQSKLNGLLPYWDPTTSIPSAFSGSSAVISGFTPITNTNPYNGGANYNVSRFSASVFCNNYVNGTNGSSCNSTGNRPVDRFAADLECEHNDVHNNIGGVMANSQQSPAAAIFWIWHAWVDEIYWDYQSCQATYPSVPYNMNFNNGTNSFWYTGSSNRFGRVQVTTANGPRSGSHLTMDVTSNGNYSVNEAILNLNLSGMSNVQLSFWWKEWRDETHDEDGIYLSDGGPFVKVASLSNGSLNTWTYKTYNISSLANSNGLSHSNTFRIKFQQYDNFTISTDGFAFDDISVTGTMNSGHCGDFETGWDWWYDISGDDGNWTRHNGGTASTNTGPSGAFNGDYYVYLEASTSGVSYPSNTAILQKQLYNSSLNRISFNYHMYGQNMGSLALQVSNSSNSGYTQIWSRSGNQGNSWQSATVTIPSGYLSGGYYLRFVGTTGSNWLSDIALDNICFSSTSKRLDDDGLAGELTLDMQAYPNPFSQSTTIEYTLSEASEVLLSVHDMTGKEIKRLVNGVSQDVGMHQVVFDAEDIPNGIYFYTLQAQGVRKTDKLILQR